VVITFVAIGFEIVTFALLFFFKSVAIELADPVFSSMILSREDSDRAKEVIDALSALIEQDLSALTDGFATFAIWIKRL